MLPAPRNPQLYHHEWVAISIEPVMATVVNGKLHVLQDPQGDRAVQYGCLDCPEKLTAETIDNLCPEKFEMAQTEVEEATTDE